MKLLTTFILIIVLQIIYVSAMSIRQILMVKGMKELAAFISLIDVSIYLISLKIVFENLDNTWNMVAYAIGFAIGIYTGSKLEEKLALGYLECDVTIASEGNENITEYLRSKGIGVTSWKVEGRSGEKIKLQVLIPRKELDKFTEELHNVDSHAFIVIRDNKKYFGGYVKELFQK